MDTNIYEKCMNKKYNFLKSDKKINYSNQMDLK